MISNSTYAITSRFGKPSKDLLVDYINAWNKKAFTPDQFIFGTPVSKDIEGQTEINIQFAHETGFSEVVSAMTYYRIDMDTILQGQPLVIHSTSTTDEGLIAAIQAQYGILLEPALVQFTAIEEGVDYVLAAKPEHLLFFGSIEVHVRPALELLGTTIDSLMDLREFYSDGTQARPPLDVYTPGGEFLLLETALKNPDLKPAFTLLVGLREAAVINEDSDPMTIVMEALTGDDWVIDDVAAPFNLMGARIIYNGRVSATHPVSDQRFSHVMVFELGELCSNLSGIGRIAYSYAKSLPLVNQLNNPGSVSPIFQR